MRRWNGGQAAARVVGAPTALLLTLGLLMAAVTAGTQAPVGTTAAAPVAATLDYGPDAAGRLAPVRAEFIADQLGAAFAPGPARNAASASGIATPGATARLEADRVAAAVAKEFRCVGGRQTEDPLAPPCDDSNFTGDNGGATWNGVSTGEVRVLVRVEGGEEYAPPPPARSGTQTGAPPADGYVDLGLAPKADEPILAGPFRDLQTYFNRRYQTFGRAVRLILYFDDGYTHPASVERNLAVENDIVVRPFSALSLIHSVPNVDSYLEAIAQRDVVGFDGAHYRTQRFFDRRAGRLWGYHASIEQQADLYASYVCQKVVGHPVAIAGDPVLQGRPRRIGLLRTANPSQLDYLELGRRIRQQVGACGGTIVEEATYRTNGEQCTNLPHEQDRADITQARSDLARFRAAGVTTVLWPGCPTSAHPIAASADGWLPEWVLLGDAHMSQAALAGTLAAAGAVWDRHAVMVSARPYQPPVWQTRCWAALQETDPHEDEVSGRYTVCDWFGALQQVFAGIQLAGPRLTPDALSAGFRRLRVAGSPDPQVPTCSYEPGDSTCIKDGHALFFDLDGGASEFEPAPGIDSGVPYVPAACWLAVEKGRRHLPGAWPAGNIDAQFRSDDPCTYDQQQVLREGTPVGRL